MSPNFAQVCLSILVTSENRQGTNATLGYMVRVALRVGPSKVLQIQTDRSQKWVFLGLKPLFSPAKRAL
jgi:hypothetical protein